MLRLIKRKLKRRFTARLLESWKQALQKDLNIETRLLEKIRSSANPEDCDRLDRVQEALEQTITYLNTRYNWRVYFSSGSKVIIDQK